MHVQLSWKVWNQSCKTNNPTYLEVKPNSLGEQVTSGSFTEDVKADLRRRLDKLCNIIISVNAWNYGMLEIKHWPKVLWNKNADALLQLYDIGWVCYLFSVSILILK